MRTTAHYLAATAALAALLATALGISGCSNRGCTCPDEVEDLYKLRTSPENVLYNLKTAYVDMNLDEYIDCLAEEFEFHVNPRDSGDPYWDIPETWNKAVEETIHRRMFADDADVERVTLTLTSTSKEWNASDDLWRYTEAPDLRITVTGDLTFLATSDQLFVLAIDEDRGDSDGEELWEIVEWHDLEEEWHRLGEDSTWSSIKWLYR